MSQETLKMSRKERRRLVVMRRYARGEILLKEAAWEMRVSVRQAIRIKQRFEERGAEGLIHRSRDAVSKRSYAPEFRGKVLELYQEKYHDFGPTLACEKLAESDSIEVSRETLRQWLIADGMWRVGAKERVHRTKRPRRERFGEMLQIDGSDHAWFEERAPRSTLMVLVDDATGKIMLHMAPSETTEAALTLLGKWIGAHGVPVALYADRRTAYFTQAFIQEPERRDDPETFTQFMRVARRLGLEMIPAYSPQGKGRVERMNGLLQDRLVKELRLLGIDTIDGANAMLNDFANEMNRRFEKEPLRPADAHRRAPKGRREWDALFCYEETRKVQKDNTVVWRNQWWQILNQEGAPKPGQTVTLRTPLSAREPYWVLGEKRLKTRYLGAVKRRVPRPLGGQPPHPRDLAH
jgi:hypothetical protein